MSERVQFEWHLVHNRFDVLQDLLEYVNMKLEPALSGAVCKAMGMKGFYEDKNGVEVDANMVRDYLADWSAEYDRRLEHMGEDPERYIS